MMVFMASPAGVRRTVHESTMPRPYHLVRLFLPIFLSFFGGRSGICALTPPSTALRFALFASIVLLSGSRMTAVCSLQRLALSVCYFFIFCMSTGFPLAMPALIHLFVLEFDLSVFGKLGIMLGSMLAILVVLVRWEVGGGELRWDV